MGSRHYSRLWRIASILVAGLLAATAAATAADLQFDGKRDSTQLAGDQRLVASDVGEIAVAFTRGAGTEDGAVFLLVRGHDTFFYVGYSLDNAALSFDTSAAAPVLLGQGRLANSPRHLLKLTAGEAGWGVSLDGAAIGTLGDEFLPKPAERLELSLGGAGFVGAIDLAVTSRQGFPYAQIDSRGRLQARTLPRAGIYVAQDSGRTGVAPEDLPGVSKDHHGIFKKQTFYAVTATPGGVAVAVDWGGVLELLPDPENPKRYRPKSAADLWAGSVEFADDTSARTPSQFKAVGGHATGRRPFLTDGLSYILQPPRNVGEGEQSIGSVWAGTNFPPNFIKSIESCYNIVTMNLANFQELGCGGNAVFALPPAKEGGYSNEAAPHILPFGWKWYVDVVAEQAVFSTLVTSSEDASQAYGGGSSSGFNVLGYAQSHNEQSEQDYRQLAGSERMRSVQQFFQRQYSVVADPDVIYLDPCFVRRALRAAAGFKARQLGVSPAALTDEQLPAGPDYFDAKKSLRACNEGLDSPYPVAQFLTDYGTHYAHAITYGGRAVRTAKFDKTDVLKMIGDSHNLNTSEGFEFQLHLGNKNVGYDVKGGGEGGTTRGTKATQETSKSYKTEEAQTKCYGGVSCSADAITIGNEPIPIYLDLVRLDRLLAPPYFTDLTVVRDLRRAVAAEIDKVLANAPPPVPPVLRILNVELADKKCTYAPNLRDPSGQFYGAFAWVEGLCQKMEESVVAAYSADGQSAALVPMDQINPSSFELGLWPDMPPLQVMTACFDAGGGPAPLGSTTCHRRKFRMIVQPKFSASGTPGANQQIGFQLFQSAAEAAGRVPNCGAQCDVKYGFWIGDWPQAQAARWDDPVVFSTSFVGFSQTAAVPPSVTGKAVAFYRYNKDPWNDLANFSSMPAEWFSAELTFKLTEEDLPGALGFASPTGQASGPEDLSLSAVQPSGAFAWQAGDGLNNRGMFRRCEAVFGLGNCEERAAIVYAKPPSQRRFNSLLANAALCENDSVCQSGACARLTAAAGAPLQCCPSGRAGVYAFNAYCLGMTRGSECWSDNQCASQSCRDNMGGLKRGRCQ